MLRTQLMEAVKLAMKNKETARLSTLRMVNAAIKDMDIAGRTTENQDLSSDDKILGLLQKLIKQRRQSMDMYQEAGRAELVEKEKAEIEVISEFLPQQMSEAEIEATIKKAIADLGITSSKDMGKLMGHLKQHYGGQMDFSKASQLIKQQLSA